MNPKRYRNVQVRRLLRFTAKWLILYTILAKGKVDPYKFQKQKGVYEFFHLKLEAP